MKIKEYLMDMEEEQAMEFVEKCNQRIEQKCLLLEKKEPSETPSEERTSLPCKGNV